MPLGSPGSYGVNPRGSNVAIASANPPDSHHRRCPRLPSSSASSAWLIRQGDPVPPEGAIRRVDLSLEQLGPISSRITAVIPPEGPSPAITNRFLLLYATANSGALQWQVEAGAPFSSLGSFTQDRPLVGPDVAPAQLQPSESYSFRSISAGITNLHTLVVTDPNSGNGVLILNSKVFWHEFVLLHFIPSPSESIFNS